MMHLADRPKTRYICSGGNMGSCVIIVIQVVHHSTYLNTYECCKYECIAGANSYTSAARRIFAIGS